MIYCIDSYSFMLYVRYEFICLNPSTASDYIFGISILL